MFYENVIVALIVTHSIHLFTSTTNAFATSNDTNINQFDLKIKNYTIKDDNVILDSLVGNIRIPIPEKFRAEHNAFRLEDNQKMQKLISYFDNVHPNAAEFFECTEQAQIAILPYTESFRYWEAFFKRNFINDTFAARYCCNLLEYVDSAQIRLSLECRDQIRLQDYVMLNPEVRSKCRQYEFNSVQCFFVRWMYWWIAIITLFLIAFMICVCFIFKCRRTKHYIKPSKERSSLVTGI